MTLSLGRTRGLLALGAVLAALLVAAPTASAYSYYGNNYNNYIYGSMSADLILGYGGHDELIGSWGGDTIAGHQGNDRLYGSAGWDTLNGGEGNDMLASGADAAVDVLHCGPGWDTAYTNPEDITTGCEVIY
jgi:Ca2+-binding RTX toxin-like protein